jgi:mono/diheme cytochrome c family protein
MFSRFSVVLAVLAACAMAFGIAFSSRAACEKLGRVEIYLSTDCPVAMKYTPRLNRLYGEFADRFEFKAYFPNDLETRAGVLAYFNEREYKFPFELDLGGVRAQAEGVTHVPTVIVFDQSGRKVYQGAIDDNGDSSLVRRHYVRDVLNELQTGRAPAFASTETFGCILMPGAVPPAQTEVNYAEHVAEILNKHCVECHRPGEVAPFSLVGYENAKKWAPMIALVTEGRRMPPWKAVHGFGEFLDENRLSELQIETLRRWSDAGAPRGDASREPAAPRFSSDWSLGQPDMVVSPSKSFKLEAEGKDVYRNFVISPGHKEPLYVTAMDVRPGNARIVHHVIAFIDTSGRGKSLAAETNDGQEGYITFGGPGFMPSGALGGWAPGLRARHLAEGMAFVVPPGADIVIQVHYHKSGKPEEDLTKLALYLAKEPPKQEVRLAWIANPAFRIPAGAPNHRVAIEFTAPSDITIHSLMPHMHLLGKSMKAEVQFPDGRTRPLIFVDDWDFNWQMNYALKQPMQVPRGSKIKVEAFYDNSAQNRRNPNDPPKDVTWGEETTDEMFLLVAAYTIDGQRLGASGDGGIHAAIAAGVLQSTVREGLNNLLRGQGGRN